MTDAQDSASISMDLFEDELEYDTPTKKRKKGDIIQFRLAKLISLKRSIKELKNTVIDDIHSEINEIKDLCSKANRIFGEMNDTNGKNN